MKRNHFNVTGIEDKFMSSGADFDLNELNIEGLFDTLTFS